jgi:GntR family transcriptional regulator, vanillate catabolism transcriptional regulator
MSPVTPRKKSFRGILEWRSNRAGSRNDFAAFPCAHGTHWTDQGQEMAGSGIIVQIRDMILAGDLPPGSPVTEAGLAEVLGVSRTPVRNVLPALEREGLLEPRGRRGFAVRGFSAHESLAALETRSTIEGMAARMVARQGASEELVATLRDCLAKGDAIFVKRRVNKEDEGSYGEMNGRFHHAIIRAVGSPLVSEMYARVNLVPFAAPTVIAFDRHGLDKAFELLFYAHAQHHAIVDAIVAQDSARAEFLFREHANQQRASMWAAAEEEMASVRPKRRRKTSDGQGWQERPAPTS